MIENTNRTHIITSNKMIIRQQGNLDLYSLDSSGNPIQGDRTYIPIKSIDELYILKKCVIDTETLAFLADNNVLVHFHSRNTRYIGSFYPNSKASINKSGHVLLQQLRAFDDPSHRLYIAKQITYGHISNMFYNLKKYKIENNLLELSQKAKQSESIQELMGFEGAAKKEYYSSWDKIIKDQKSFKFTIRSKRPPADKINVLISYLNSRIYNICLSEIYKTELDPRISFLHEPNHRSISLHLDVAEIFKPLIGDNIIFNILNKKILRAEHFVKKSGLWTLETEGIKIIELHLIKKLSEINCINEMKLNYRFTILKEVNKIKKSLVEYAEYQPFIK
ncbi:CRISPR-associated endonuclease Cas1 [Aquamicrobium sp.]|uniref:CRISPR-associated endonuclease Cas1 n=1 Tax=Aquamicrobium sp. TaxID=1872579 RepID=UPI002587EC3D|nr:CRISPR-associated endonuclease Cas1 [Aquamicrobium sp.]MCK9549265.1 CRISPR-associated endonuclease Cas1 [Aquamicrobium sp.]